MPAKTQKPPVPVQCHRAVHAVVCWPVLLVHRAPAAGQPAADTKVISRSGDLIRKVRSPDASRCVKAKQQALLTVRNNREYVLESVLGERGVIAHKTKEYKVKWQDYSEVSCNTWVSHKDTDRNCQPWLDYKKRKKQESHTIAGVSTIAADLLMLPAATMIQCIILCQQAGIQESEIMFIYAGVPCETYSIAGHINVLG